MKTDQHWQASEKSSWRFLLGMLSVFAFFGLFTGFFFAAMFGAGWEGGHRREYHESWTSGVSIAPLIYVVYCFLCSVFEVPALLLLATGIAAHIYLACFLITGVVLSIQYPGISAPTPFIIASVIFAAIWFRIYRLSRSQERQSKASPIPYDY